MRILLQRVSQASVTVEDRVSGSIDAGLLLFIGITVSDTGRELQSMADKVANLRIFEDADGRMNLSILELLAAGRPVGVMAVSQFTLYGDVRKGRRPSFVDAAPAARAAPMIETFACCLERLGLAVERGKFGAHMMVSLVNDGPVTIWIDSDDLGRQGRGSDSGTP